MALVLAWAWAWAEEVARVLGPALDPGPVPGRVHLRHHTRRALAMGAPEQAPKLVPTLALTLGQVREGMTGITVVRGQARDTARVPAEEAAAVEKVMVRVVATARDVVTAKAVTIETKSI